MQLKTLYHIPMNLSRHIHIIIYIHYICKAKFQTNLLQLKNLEIEKKYFLYLKKNIFISLNRKRL